MSFLVLCYGVIIWCSSYKLFYSSPHLLCSGLYLLLNLTRFFISSHSLFLSFQVTLLPASAPQRLVQMRLSSPFWSRPKESCRCRKLVSRSFLLFPRGLKASKMIHCGWDCLLMCRMTTLFHFLQQTCPMLNHHIQDWKEEAEVESEAVAADQMRLSAPS